MECKVQKSDLLRALRIAQSIADRKSTMPMLANVLLRTTGKNKLLIAATDLNVSISAELTSENAAEGGLTVSAKSIYDIVSRLPGRTMVMRHSGTVLQIEAGHVGCEIPAMPDRDFPRIPDSSGLEFGEVDSGVLREMIDRTLFSVSSDETRFHLNGVLFESNGANARMVSTDGHRLAKVDRRLAGGPNLSAGIIIPTKGMQELKEVIDGAGSVGLAVETPYLFVRGDAMTLAIKLIETQNPPYDTGIPKKHDIEVVFDDSLLASLWRALPICKETRGVMLRCDGRGVRLDVEHPDIGRQFETVYAMGLGEAWDICFNPRYWYEHIESMAPGEIVLRMSTDPLAPVTLQSVGDPDHIAVIMPMRPW